jgi:tetratricopeptide (TPR) repeat protein
MFMKRTTLILALIGLFALNNSFAQTYLQTKDVNLAEIDSFVKEIERPAQAEMRYWFNAGDMNEKKYQTKEEQLKELPKYEKLVKKNPNDLVSYDKLQKLLILKNPDDTATYNASRRFLITKYQEKLAKNNKDGEAMYQLANSYALVKDYVKAFDYAIDAKNAMPDSAKTYSQIAWLNNMLGEYEKAKKFSHDAIAKNDSEMDYYITALTADLFVMMSQKMKNEVKDIALNREYIEKAKKKYPKREDFETLHQTSIVLEIFYNTMFGLFSTMGDSTVDAKKTMLNLKSTDIQLPTLQTYFENLSKTHKGGKSFIYSSLGMIEFLKGRQNESKDLFIKAIAENPEKGQLYTNVAFLHLIHEEYEKAEQIMLKKLNITEEASDYVVLAEIYRRLKQNDKSDEILDKGIAKHPYYAKSLFFKALNLYEAKQYNESYEKTLASLKADRNNIDAALLYGLLCLRLNEINGALDALYYASQNGNKTASKVFKTYFKLKE